MNKTIETLKIEAENIRNIGANEANVHAYILRLKNLIDGLRATELDKNTLEYLTSFVDYRTFDELPWISRFFHHMIIYKARPDYYENWKERGKYLYDLDSIIIKLDALLFRLKNKHL